MVVIGGRARRRRRRRRDQTERGRRGGGTAQPRNTCTMTSYSRGPGAVASERSPARRSSPAPASETGGPNRSGTERRTAGRGPRPGGRRSRTWPGPWQWRTDRATTRTDRTGGVRVRNTRDGYFRRRRRRRLLGVLLDSRAFHARARVVGPRQTASLRLWTRTLLSA